MMKVIKYMFLVIGISGAILVITAIPFLISYIQDKKLLNQEVQINNKPISVEMIDKDSAMSLKDKILLAKNKFSADQVDLKTGKLMTRVKAEEVALTELNKIVKRKGVEFTDNQEQFGLSPVLFINLDDPSLTMIVWRGFVKASDLAFMFYLDEESKKIIYIQDVYYRSDGESTELQRLWNDYINQ